jgi:hypothetical protein
MKRGKQDLASLIVFCAASAVVMVGIIMSFAHGPTRSRVAEARSLRGALPTQATHAARSGGQLGRSGPEKVAPAQPPAAVGDAVAPVTSPEPKPAAAEGNSRLPTRRVAPTPQASPPLPPLPQRRFATRADAAGAGSVPPLLPPPYGTTMASVAVPPPQVLRLTGVVDGDKRLAILRRGAGRYMVHEGDTVEGQRVVSIGPASVMLQRGTRKRTLRLSR